MFEGQTYEPHTHANAPIHGPGERATDASHFDGTLFSANSFRLTDRDWDVLLSGARSVVYKRGEVIIDEGQVVQRYSRGPAGPAGRPPYLRTHTTPYSSYPIVSHRVTLPACPFV